VRTTILIITVLCVAATGVTGCATLFGGQAAVTGTVVGPRNTPQPISAVITVWIEDPSEASGTVFAKTTLKALPGWEVAGMRQGNTPYGFTIPYDPSRVLKDHVYLLHAKIDGEEALTGETTTATPVLTGGAPVSGIAVEMYPSLGATGPVPEPLPPVR
jgi:uncharacterized lipoprotein YbaY